MTFVLCNLACILMRMQKYVSDRLQCFFYSRNIGLVTPNIYYFYYLTKYFLAQSIQKIWYFILKTEALLRSGGQSGCDI